LRAVPLHPIAGTYLGRALDPIIQAASAVAGDAAGRPEAYQQLPDDVAQLLADFNDYIGSHPDWPDTEQRLQIARRTLGRFYLSFASVRRAAIALAGSASARNEQVATRSLVQEVQSLRSTVRPLEGEELDAPAAILSSLLQRAETVLTAAPVSTVFGVPLVPAGSFPDGGAYSPEMAYLCEFISKALPLEGSIRQPRLSIIQRAAHYGAVTLAGVLDPSFDAANGTLVDNVVHSASSWADALGDLLDHVDVVRAWTDPRYREQLMTLERDLIPPHPAGEIDLEGTNLWSQSRRFGFSVSTETVDHEVCCCSGDLCGSTNGVCTDDECPTLIIMAPVPQPPN
jgi:mersacidin/lichenicidin family type 2 lantibiotic